MQSIKVTSITGIPNQKNLFCVIVCQRRKSSYNNSWKNSEESFKNQEFQTIWVRKKFLNQCKHYDYSQLPVVRIVVLTIFWFSILLHTDFFVNNLVLRDFPQSIGTFWWKVIFHSFRHTQLSSSITLIFDRVFSYGLQLIA